MTAVPVFAPAKLNLFLAITGRRADGFHDLVSVVVQLNFGDTVTCEASSAKPEVGFSLVCNDAAVPADESNLVLRAARAFVAATDWKGGAHFSLEKRIPTGAGLGGGSSDAVAALRAMNEVAGKPLDAPALATLAAQLGSDCPLFLHEGPVVMRGRGERIEPLAESAARRLRGRRVLVFKPGFPIATPWAYAQLAAGAPGSYLPAAEAERRLEAWIGDLSTPAETLLFNNMEPPAFAKYVALPALLDQLRRDFGLQPRMSGSGSACFAFLGADMAAEPIIAAIRGAWGASAFVIEARIA